MAINSVTFGEQTLTITINGLDKMWSFKSNLVIPYTHIAGATLDNEALAEPTQIYYRLLSLCIRCTRTCFMTRNTFA